MAERVAQGGHIRFGDRSIITMDRNGRIVEFNPAAERTFGYKAGKVVGNSAVALFTPADMQRKHTTCSRAYR